MENRAHHLLDKFSTGKRCFMCKGKNLIITASNLYTANITVYTVGCPMTSLPAYKKTEN